MPGGALYTTRTSFAGVRALGAAIVRELVWGLRGVSREVTRWRSFASEIPDPTIRGDALEALSHKRPNTDGAALLWIVPTRRCEPLLRLLVAYEIMGDFLDSTIERGAHVGLDNGRQLHRALVDAIDLECPISDYYLFHPWNDDGGYLTRLVEACRAECRKLPSYQSARPYLIKAAKLAQVQGINHEPEVLLREAVLEAWAAEEAGHLQMGWYEIAGAASAWLTVLALMAVAAEPGPAQPDASRVFSAYFPWIALAATLLDSYDDLVEDRENETDSFLARYGSLASAVARIDELVSRATSEARALPKGDSHAVIVASMVALYLSKDSVRTPEMVCISKRLLRAGGPLAMLLGPVLRAWRILYALQDT